MKIGPHHYRVSSRSRPGIYHEVQLGPVVLCTCEAFYWRGECRHIATALNYSALDRARANDLTVEQAYTDIFGDEDAW